METFLTTHSWLSKSYGWHQLCICILAADREVTLTSLTVNNICVIPEGSSGVNVLVKAKG